jgi:hypothetical protein
MMMKIPLLLLATAVFGFAQVSESLLCYWDFEEKPGQARLSKGRYRYALQEVGGPLDRSTDARSGKYSIVFPASGGRFLRLAHGDSPGLNIHGRRPLTVTAWVKRTRNADGCEAIAGKWNETGRRRQYALFLDLKIWNSGEQVGGHVSDTGGSTPGHPWCMTASIGQARVPFGEWRMISFTYDGEYVRSYLDGRLDRRSKYNPFYFPHGLFDGGSDFTVGAVKNSNTFGNWYSGLLDGLAVFGKALGEAELTRIFRGGIPVP